MEGSSEEEEGEEERERLKCVAVTSEDLFSSHEAKKGPRGRQATSNDVLARRLQQWVESYYDFTGSTDNDDVIASSATAVDSRPQASSGILLTRSSLHPVTLSPPPFLSHSAHRKDTWSSSSSSEEEEEEKKRLQEAVFDPKQLTTTHQP